MGVLVAACIGMCPTIEVAPFSPGLQKWLFLLSAKIQDRKLSLPPTDGKRNGHTSFQSDHLNCRFTKNSKTTHFLELCSHLCKSTVLSKAILLLPKNLMCVWGWGEVLTKCSFSGPRNTPHILDLSPWVLLVHSLGSWQLIAFCVKINLQEPPLWAHLSQQGYLSSPALVIAMGV